MNKLQLIVVALVVVACKKTELSPLKHEFGETVARRDGPLASCKEDSKDESVDERIRNAIAYSKTRRSAIGYLEKVADHLISKNPDTFREALAREKICVYLEQRGKTSFGATADVRNGAVLIADGMLFNAQSDSQVAAQLAHELAHITRNHRHAEPTQEELKIQEEMAKISARNIELMKDNARAVSELASASMDEDFMEAAKTYLNWIIPPEDLDDQADSGGSLRDIEVKLKPLIDDYLKKNLDDEQAKPLIAAYQRSRTAIAELNERAASVEEKIKKQALATKSVTRKHEAEADEVGYELYLRAQFESSDYMWARERKILYNPSDEEAIAALEECREKIAKGEKPEEGSDTHPFPCWRIYNIYKSEAEKHAENYRPLLARAKIRFIEGDDAALIAARKDVFRER